MIELSPKQRQRLEQDWEHDRQLRCLAFDSVEELAEHLAKLHRDMLSGGCGVFGYLYKRQHEKLKKAQD